MDKEEFVKDIRKDLGIKTYQEMGQDANLKLNFDFEDDEIEELRRVSYKKSNKKKK